MRSGATGPEFKQRTSSDEKNSCASDCTNSWATDQTSLSDADFLAALLQRQCTALSGARSGIVLRKNRTGLEQIAVWPTGTQPSPELIRVAERAATALDPIIAWTRPTGVKSGIGVLIGIRMESHSTLTPVIAVAVDNAGGIDSVDPNALAEQLHLGCGWLEARLARRQSQVATARADRAAFAMHMVAIATVQRRPVRAATAIVNELAARIGCDRVSLGLNRGNGVRLKASSHVASFQERGRVVDAIENAMEECLAQAAPVAYPSALLMKSKINIAHRDLSVLGPVPSATASVVLPGSESQAGVLTLERQCGAPFSEEELLLAEAVGSLLGPVLSVQVANDRLIAGRIGDSAHSFVQKLFGRANPSLKLAALAITLAATLLSVAKGDFRVTVTAVLEGEVQRAAVAPFDGFVAVSPVRPGDRVRAGELLATMDDRDLVLERARAWADTEKARQKYDEAMAKHDRPNAAMLAAQIAQAEAQLALADDKLSRSRIVSPIDGLLVSGDLSQMLGSPVERGKKLFEIAPLDHYRIVLQTDERDLRYVSLGQPGELFLAGMPTDRLRFTVNRITPIAEAKDGRNQFRVEGALDQPPRMELRPGMEGVGKIVTARHHLLWIWSHGLLDWARLTAWKWIP